MEGVGGLGPLGDLQVLVLGVGDGQLVQLIARVGLHGDGDAGASGGLVRADGHGAVSVVFGDDGVGALVVGGTGGRIAVLLPHSGEILEHTGLDRLTTLVLSAVLSLPIQEGVALLGGGGQSDLKVGGFLGGAHSTAAPGGIQSIVDIAVVGVDAVAVLGLKFQIRIRILRHRRGVTAALYSSLGFRRCPILIDGNNRLTDRYGEGTALNGQNTLIDRISTVTSVDQYRTSALLYTERTALDRGLIPVHHCGLLGIFKGAIHNGQLGPVIIFYCIQAAAERTASDHQLRNCMVYPFDITVAWIFIGIIVISICDHAGETAALAYSYTIIDSHTAVVQNVIIGIFSRSLWVFSSLLTAGVLPPVQHYGTVVIDRGTGMARVVYCTIPLDSQGRTILHCDRIL